MFEFGIAKPTYSQGNSGTMKLAQRWSVAIVFFVLSPAANPNQRGKRTGYALVENQYDNRVIPLLKR